MTAELVTLNDNMSQTTLQDWHAPLSARSLSLGFLSAVQRPMRVADLVRRAEVMGLDGAALRVALGRLCREGLVQQVERGLYAIGPGGEALDRRARSWAAAEERVTAWTGRWLIVLVDHLGRSDRRRLRERERALMLYGLARTPSGAWVRPDNLADPLPQLAMQLHAIGLDPDATIIGDASSIDDQQWRGLWPRKAIEAGYRHWIAEMSASTARLPAMPVEEAARETLLLGQSVIRAINRDPLLPSALIDTGLRAAMIDAMRGYDAVGKAVWDKIA
jgi:phenylacetic acid degradation operon negative regulatory protein